jgi:hypothetical protein
MNIPITQAGNSNSNPSHNESRQKELHFGFVELLFALAIAEVALQAGKFADHGTEFLGKNLVPYLPGYTHIVLALIVIATSWFGWGNSKYGFADAPDEISVFSFEFVEALLNVFLVVIYFMLAHSIETPEDKNPTCLGDLSYGAKPEILFIVVIMGLYFVWDIVSKRKSWADLKQRGWASLSCFLFSLFLSIFVLPWEAMTAWAVVVTDLCLLGVVILFRAMKRKNWSEWNCQSASCWIVLPAIGCVGLGLFSAYLSRIGI